MILLISALAVYRLTRLVTEDTILDRPRGWAIGRAEWLGTLVTCPWCAGFWIALATTIALAATSAVALPLVGWVLLPFAFSAVTGILSSWV